MFSGLYGPHVIDPSSDENELDAFRSLFGHNFPRERKPGIIFQLVEALAAPPGEYGHSLYLGYAWFPEANRAMSSLCSRLKESQVYLEGIARAIGETSDSIKKSWHKRVKPLNTLASESQHRGRGVKFPDSIDTRETDE